MLKIARQSRTACAVVLCAFAGPSLLGQAVLTQIPAIPSSGTAVASAISADGSTVAGYCYGSTVRAFRWTRDGGTVALGTLAGLTNSVATGISDDGQVIVGYCYTLEVARSFRWTAVGGMQDLGAPSDLPAVYAFAVSGDGRVVTGGCRATVNPQLSRRPFRWTTETGVQLLSATASGDGAAASGDGSVIVGGAGGTGGGFKWTVSTGFVPLVGLPGDSMTFARGVTTDGLTIVGWSGVPNSTRAVRWSSGGVPEDLAPPQLADRAEAVSGDGSVIMTRRGDQDACVWRQSTGAVPLRYLVLDWNTYAEAHVSRDGRTFCGARRLGNALPAYLIENLSACGTADIASANAVPGSDQVLDNNDFILFIELFFHRDATADRGRAGGLPGPDGQHDSNDLIVFIDQFFNHCM